jgi:Leucine Rich repeat
MALAWYIIEQLEFCEDHGVLNIHVMPGELETPFENRRCGVEIGATLSRSTSLTKLKVRGSGCTPEGCLGLLTGAVCCTSLEDLVIENINELGNEALYAIHRRDSWIGLRRLVLTQMCAIDNHMLSAALLNPNLALRSLSLNQCELRDEGATAIAECLNVTVQTITELCLENNGITDVGVEALAAARHTNETLEVLNLFRNDINNRGAAALSRVVDRNARLRCLKLGRNQIGDDGTTAIAAALNTQTALRVLDLSGNCITKRGAFAMSEAILRNTGLAELCMQNNRLRPEGRAAFYAKIPYNRSLRKLLLMDPTYDAEKEGSAHVKSIKGNFGLTEVDFPITDRVSDDVYKQVRPRLEAELATRGRDPHVRTLLSAEALALRGRAMPGPFGKGIVDLFGNEDLRRHVMSFLLPAPARTPGDGDV